MGDQEMASRNEDRNSTFINANDIFRKLSDENFENLIEGIKDANYDGRMNIGKNALAQLLQQFQLIWDNNVEEYVRALVLFVSIARIAVF